MSIVVLKLSDVKRVNVEFLTGPPTDRFFETSTEFVSEKMHFGSSRRAR